MESQWFETKKAFLEYLWKDPNDRKLVDRMIHDGRASKRDWMYYVVDKNTTIRELRGRIEELEKKLKEKEKSETTNTVSVPRRVSDTTVWEMLCHLRYLYDRHWDMRNAILDITSKYHAAYWGKYNLDDFREELYKKIWFIPDMKDDDDELDFIAKFMKDNDG